MEPGLSFRTNACRVCRSTALAPILSLAPTPPANAFLRPEEVEKPEPHFPLELLFCETCRFVQLGDVVSPELLFGTYVYVSSTSPVFVAHFEELAETLTRRFDFPPNSLAVDIGSNDGILLRPLAERGWRVLGIDPAREIAARASGAGVETIPAFFSTTLACALAEERGGAKLISATSVFPHVHDLDDLVAGVAALLDEDGVFVIEAYYLGAMLRHNLFDTVYHEHLSYFTLRSLMRLFERLGMSVFDVEETETHGGSLRVFVSPAGRRPLNHAALRRVLDEEDASALGERATYAAFGERIERNKRALRTLLLSLKESGKRLAGYGAPAKGNTLLTHFGIGAETLDYIVDDSAWKQGRYTPGTHIRVVSAEALREAPPDYLLILAWNFAKPIMAKLADFKAHGGRFIVPVPEPVVL